MAHNNKEVMPQSKPSIYHYSITVDGEQLEVDIPDMVKSVFDEEFGSLDEEVKQTNLFKVAVPVVDGVKTKTRMNITGQSVVQKWQNGSVSPLSVTEADSISFITIQHYA